MGSAWPGFGALLLTHLIKHGDGFDPEWLLAGDDLTALIAFARSLRCLAECDEADRNSNDALLDQVMRRNPPLARFLRRAMLWDFADLSFLDSADLKRVVAGFPAVEVALPCATRNVIPVLSCPAA
jgi:hypothetical protein